MASRRREGVGRSAAFAAFVALAGCASELTLDRVSREYLSCDSPEAQAAYERALSLVSRGRQADAIAPLRLTLDRCPRFALAHVAYQDVAHEVGGDAEAEMREFYAGVEDDPSSPLEPFLLSRITEHDANRLPLLDTAIERDPSFHLAYLEKALILRRLNRTNEALTLLQRSVTACPECADSNRELAQVLAGLGRAREAAVHYANYTEARPEDVGARREYLRLLVYSLERFDEAEGIVHTLLAKDPEDVVTLMDRAAIAWRRGEALEAAGIYRRVLEIDPSRDRAVLNLANLYYEAIPGDSEEERRDWWPKARTAYRYFLEMRRAEGVYDVLDYHIGVPYRLARIADLLGPAPREVPTLRDL